MRSIVDILKESIDNSTAFVRELDQIQEQDKKFWSQIRLRITPNDFEAGDVTIDTMEVQEKGKGDGRKMLQTLTDLADKHQVMLRLELNKDGDSLVPWFQRHGFEATGEYGHHGGEIMHRKPW